MLIGGLLFLPWASSLSQYGGFVSKLCDHLSPPAKPNGANAHLHVRNSNVALLALVAVFALRALMPTQRIAYFRVVDIHSEAC